MFRRVLLIGLSILITLTGTDASAETRNPAVAGAFYPANAEDLRNTVTGHLDAVGRLPEIEGRIVALIVPHAGLVYSGQIAAHSYKLLEKSQVNTVILCGPSHRYPLQGISVYGPGVTWQTPLGSVACNDRLCRDLIQFDDMIRAIPEAHAQEHCLEVQLPYLQTVLSEFTITPLLMGRPTPNNLNLLADALGALELDEHTVLISSTDWQHYHPASEGWPMDSLGMDCLQRLDIDRLQRYLGNGKVEACGGGALVAVLKAAVAHGADKVQILNYGDSGDINRDKSQVVGYVAAVVYDSNPTNDGDTGVEENQTEGNEMDEQNRENDSAEASYLSDDEKQQLLKIARETIASYLSGSGIPEFEVSGVLAEDGAAFVTLEKHGRLRGCIGYTEAIAPLYRTVTDCAVSAAVRDPRFPPVTAAEIDQLHIEISVLTPLKPIESFDEIQVGRDGLMIVKGSYRGLLLPQVATDYGWNRTEFLQHTCQKAGLPPDAYKSPDATVYTFTALVFGEE